MTMYLSKSKRKRELATVCRMGFEMAGILLSLVLQAAIIGDPSGDCVNLSSDAALQETTELMTTAMHNSTVKPANAFQEFYDKQKYLIAALVVGIIFTKESLGKFH